MDKRTARTRWSTVNGSRRRTALLIALQEGCVSRRCLLKNAGETEEGLIDLRGLSFGIGVEFQGVKFRCIDFSYASFGRAIFRQCTFEGISFRGMDSRGWNERNCHFTDVDFDKANLRDAGLGIDGSTYVRVTFREADFTGISFVRPQFIDCDFSNAKLKNLDFLVSNFINCRFRGRLESVWFRRYYPLPNYERRMGKAVPNEMRNVDFSEAELWDPVFTGGLDLSRVILPPDGSHILFRHFGLALTKVRNILHTLPWSEDERGRVLRTIESFLVHARDQPMWILNRREILADFGQEVGEAFIALLDRFDTGDKG